MLGSNIFQPEGNVVGLRQDIELATPALRRLARALAAPGEGGGDDLVHETLLRALRHETPAPGLSIRNWLYANLVSLNRQRVRAGEGEGEAGRTLKHGDGAGGRGHLRRSFARAPAGNVETALQRLGLEEREALLLVALEGVSYTHAAMILGLPRPVLVARLARARANLGSRLDAPRQAAAAGPAAHLRVVR